MTENWDGKLGRIGGRRTGNKIEDENRERREREKVNRHDNGGKRK